MEGTLKEIEVANQTVHMIFWWNTYQINQCFSKGWFCCFCCFRCCYCCCYWCCCCCGGGGSSGGSGGGGDGVFCYCCGCCIVIIDVDAAGKLLLCLLYTPRACKYNKTFLKQVIFLQIHDCDTFFFLNNTC